MTEQEIERCLERFATCKATDVMNFDYAGTLAYLQHLKAANAELRHRAEVAERALSLACANLVKDEKGDIELLAQVVYTKFLRKAEKEEA